IILAFYSSSDPTFFHDLWSIFTFRIGLTHYLPLPTRIHPVEGSLQSIPGFNPFSSIGDFVDAYIVRTQRFFGSLGILGIFVLLQIAFHLDWGIPKKMLAALLLPLCTVWMGWAILMQEHYHKHEYQLVLATPILAIAVTCVYLLLEKSWLTIQDLRLRD